MMAHAGRRRAAKVRVAAKSSSIAHNHEHDYSALLNGVRASFDAVIANHSKLFLTDVDGLNALYLDSLPSERQTHTCHSCQRFIGVYGKLAAITEGGDLIPVMWNPEFVPEFYKAAFAAMYAKVKRARVQSVFFSKQPIWGQPITGKWAHVAVSPPSHLIFRERALTPGQAMAATKENLRTVATALTEFTAPMLDETLRLLQADTLARSEKFIGPVKWLRALHDRPKGRAGENVLWAAIASAPEGYCHPKASVIAPLLDDIVAGLPFDEIKTRFDAKMHPLRYQRPQAAPSVGNIKAAEALVAKLGIAPALERRFARVDEVQTIWTPTAHQEKAKAGGVFGHLKSKDAQSGVPPSVDIPAVTMTWDKFARTVLPNAERMDIHVPRHGNFEAYLTAVNADAPIIFKWGHPVSSYVYQGGSPATQWNLRGGVWTPIAAITPTPNMWGTPKTHLGEGVLLVIDGAIDTRTGQGNALFPECLGDELHAVRATIEAYSKSAEIMRGEGPFACGYSLRKNHARCTLRVFASGVWQAYQIDRWD